MPDEPINGLDPQGFIEIRELILKLNREQGITFIISSHLLDELSRLATHYGFIDSGHMIKEISIFARVNVSQLTLALAEENCDIISMTEREESLESYYVNLVGGKRNE